jgi:pyruvate dehydrogenase E2 component (dihydrolipoamide acetyltransferase)
MSEIVMPRLSDTMEEGTILRWLKADGEQVKRGEELVEIETDKATMTYESDQEGTLALIAAEGETLAVGAPIATVGEAGKEGEGPASRPAGSDPAQPATPADAHQTADAPTAAEHARTAEVAETAEPPESPPAPTGNSPSPTREGERGQAPGGNSPSPTREGERGQTPGGNTPSPTREGERGQALGGNTPSPAREGERGQALGGSSATPAREGERVRASPLARRIARERGLDLASVAGTGPGGRIVKADVLARTGEARGASVAQPATPAGVPAAGPEGVATAKGQTSEVELSKIQQTVARRMAESKATIPDFSLQIDVDMEECVALRAELKTIAREGAEATPTYNDMVVKACALALREHQTANGSYRDGRLLLYSRINVGVAVAAEGALIVPTVFDADSKALGEIARETRALAERVRAGTVTPPELGGGTFTVSNLGMFGIRAFTAIVNPPQAAIMAVGALERRAVVDHDGGILARQMLTLTLVCDHRILFGAEAARFLGRVRELLQSPSALTL